MKMNKKALSILLAGATVASVVVASTASASAVYEDFETEGATYGVIGDFNTWEGDVALTDEDGDGLYTATVSVPVPEEGASSTYKVRANGGWDYSWGAANADGVTANSQDNCSFTEEQYGKDVTVYLILVQVRAVLTHGMLAQKSQQLQLLYLQSLQSLQRSLQFQKFQLVSMQKHIRKQLSSSAKKTSLSIISSIIANQSGLKLVLTGGLLKRTQHGQDRKLSRLKVQMFGLSSIMPKQQRLSSITSFLIRMQKEM